jgi:type II secretion system protein N
MKRRSLLTVAAIPVTLACFLILSVLFIPSGEIRALLVRSFANQGYTFTCGSLGKALPLGIKIKNVELSDSRGALVKLDSAKISLRLLPLLRGMVSLEFSGMIGPGSLSGWYSLTGNHGGAFQINGVRLDSIPFFTTVAEAAVKGELQAGGNFSTVKGALTGEVKLEVKGAALSGIKVGGTPLPDADYRTVQGMLRLAGGKATLESFTLQGENLYVRLKGDMPLIYPLGNAPLNLTMEMMPKAELLEKQKFVFLLLLKYLSSPGHYQIPIKGTLAHPSLF